MTSRSDRRSSQPILSRFSRHVASGSVGDTGSIAGPPQPDFQRSLSAHSGARSLVGGVQRVESRRAMAQTHFLRSQARTLNLNPPVDLRLLDYVGTYDSNLMCPICRCPFVDPIVLTECDHCFCRDCIRQSWSAQYNPLGPRGDCPSCRTPAKLGPRSATTKILANILDELTVKCPKHEQGCTVEVKRGEVQDHANIYCGFALVECPAEDCLLGVRRKDVTQGCLHFGVSCLDCRLELQRSDLETHWQADCRDRKVNCDLCNLQIFYRDLSQHSQSSCSAISIPCPGKAFGCSSHGTRAQADAHAETCTFARLAPILTAQQQRMDEQETAQKSMSHKLEILETGFCTMQDILNRPFNSTDPDTSSADETHIPFLPRSNSFLSIADSTSHLSASDPPNLPLDSSSAPVSTPLGAPYTSPLHHLLSMHENLREEFSRLTAALAELDGRHSMQTLNENLRTRDEITYIGAQVAGLSRQVHWLTSAQLQRGGLGQQDDRVSPGPSTSEVAEAAVSAVGSAVRGAARVVAVGQSMRRGTSEEGRTKL